MSRMGTKEINLEIKKQAMLGNVGVQKAIRDLERVAFKKGQEAERDRLWVLLEPAIRELLGTQND